MQSKKCPITDYIRLHEKCNRLQLITITNYDYPMSDPGTLNSCDFRGVNVHHYNVGCRTRNLEAIFAA
jgi:hypothetical protein